MVNIKKMILEHLHEAEMAQHSAQRVINRIENLKVGVDITELEKNMLMEKLSVVINKNFPKNKSYAVALGRVTPQEKSSFYLGPGEGENQTQYPIYSIQNQDNSGNSNGTVFWAIVRGNVVTTILLSSAGIYKNTEALLRKLRVDVIIKNINNYDFTRQGNYNKHKKRRK